MTHERGAQILRGVWLLGTLAIFGVILLQLDIYGDRVDDVLGWFGATTAAVLALAFFGKPVHTPGGSSGDAWPVYLALALSAFHIGASLLTLARVAQTYSLAPLDQILPVYGALNPLVLGSLAILFRPADRPEKAPVAEGT